MNDGRYIIIENCSATSFAAYERVWVVENIINRPHFMRVTFYSLVPPVYHNMRNGGQHLLKSIAALRNQIMQSNRVKHYAVVADSASKIEEEKQKLNSGFDPIEFIEEESMFQGSVMDEVSSDELK